MQTNPFVVRKQPLEVDIVLLLIRLAIGYAFLLISWGKIQHPTSWMQGVVFAPGWQALAAVAEFGGAIALVLGLLTRLGALGISCVMVVATWLLIFAFHTPYINFTGGLSYQVPVAYLLIMLLLLVLGPGRFSLDRVFFGISGEQRRRTNQSNEELAGLEGAI